TRPGPRARKRVVTVPPAPARRGPKATPTSCSASSISPPDLHRPRPLRPIGRRGPADMDIHKPKPWHGLREFLKEYVIIVVGVLTALGAEAVVEWAHWRHQGEV